MTKLTHWVACEVFHRAGKWLPGWPAARIGMNVSPVDLQNPQIVHHIENMLDQNRIPADVIQVEVTESAALNHEAGAVSMLRRLADLGVGLAIDDFGAGATSLSYLPDLPFTSLKLDRGLTQGVVNERGRTVAEKTIEMARGLGMKVVLEGIETAAQAELGRELGADIGQGYYFGRPVDTGAIQSWIASGLEGFPS